MVYPNHYTSKKPRYFIKKNQKNILINNIIGLNVIFHSKFEVLTSTTSIIFYFNNGVFHKLCLTTQYPHNFVVLSNI